MLAKWRNDTAGRRAAFTLIELLMVIAIIAFLIIILIVVIKQPTEVRARQIMKELESELAAYFAVYREFPPSVMPGNYTAATGVTTGAQCLYYFLMGPSGKGWNSEPANGGVSPACSRPAAAIRPEWITDTLPDTFQKCARYFTDDPTAIQPILYYRANAKLMADGRARVLYTDIYDTKDNLMFWKPTTGAKGDWERMVLNPRSKNKAPFNPTSYFLVAAGDDRKFGSVIEDPKVEGKCDDINNAN